MEAIRAALPEIRHVLVEDLVDNQAAQVWLQQEGAFHLGMAVGLKLAQDGFHIPDNDEPVDPDELEIEDVLRFGRGGEKEDEKNARCTMQNAECSRKPALTTGGDQRTRARHIFCRREHRAIPCVGTAHRAFCILHSAFCNCACVHSCICAFCIVHCALCIVTPRPLSPSSS